MVAANSWETPDRYGNRIYMTAERWEHILDRRPWLEDYRNEILETLRLGRRKQDPLDFTKYKYYWRCDDLLPDFSHLVVVVRFDQKTDEQAGLIPNNFVLTAWAVFIYRKA